MKPKTILTAVVLAFVAVSVAYLVVKEVRSKTPEAARDEAVDPAAENAGAPALASGAAAAETATSAAPPGRVRVGYFYFGKRCSTCLKLEKYSREAVERGFPDELEEGSVTWQAINTDEPQNRHYNSDYELYAKAVIVSEMRDGEEVRWKNLTKVWQLTGDKGLFIKYVQDEVRAYLEGE